MIEERKYVRSKRSGMVYVVLGVSGDFYLLEGFPTGPFARNMIDLHKFDTEEIND